MMRTAIVAGTLLVLVTASGAVGASNDDSLPQPKWIYSKGHPKAGGTFVGAVRIFTDDVAEQYESVSTACRAALFSKNKRMRLRGVLVTESELPDDRPVPLVTVWSMRVPKRTGGKWLGFGCSGTSVLILPDNSKVVQFGDGIVVPMWRIR